MVGQSRYGKEYDLDIQLIVYHIFIKNICIRLYVFVEICIHVCVCDMYSIQKCFFYFFLLKINYHPFFKKKCFFVNLN